METPSWLFSSGTLHLLLEAAHRRSSDTDTVKPLWRITIRNQFFRRNLFHGLD